jgi:antitoxin (DNA-binding transcriptional repressor) of toxin-antitoxin stability system
MVKTFSIRELNQDTSRAKKEAENGTVFITDQGRPVHVLGTASFACFRRAYLFD